ncbi:MAG TPA: molybdate ABC transporter substrate-binding protein [Ramlibacter sp.]|nr:molybdate ABC transporter substrate-binding protein [Ramlibacter sp.]
MPKLADFLAAALAGVAALASAADVPVAVASNFTEPMQRIAREFEKDTGHRAMLAFGATGNFYAQIRNGAPFMLLLAADEQTPARLEKEGYAVAGARFTYATGRLVLWSAQPGLVDDKGAVLAKGGFDHIALANPALAPYGAAAVETLTRLDLLERVRPRFVQGENIGQAFQFVATGNAPLGFVALSQVMVNGRIEKGSAWVVPAGLHAPIRQDAVVLAPGKDSAAAAALAAYLRSDKARAIIRSYGYEF